MFDIRPVEKSGAVDFEKLKNTPSTVMLRKKIEKPPLKKSNFQSSPKASFALKSNKPFKKDFSRKNLNKQEEIIPRPKIKEVALSELENVIAQTVDVPGELEKIGGEFHETQMGELPKQKPEEPPILPEDNLATEKKLPNNPPENLPVIPEELLKKKLDFIPPKPKEIFKGDLTSALILREDAPPQITENDTRDKEEKIDSFMGKKTDVSSPAAREIEDLLDNFNTSPQKITEKKPQPVSKVNFIKRFNKKYIWGLFVVVFLLTFFIQKGIDIKNDAIDSSNKAVLNLEKAKENLEGFNFFLAANNFALASDNFSQASKKLNLIGASFVSLFSSVPGLGQVKNAKNILEAGEDVSLAGESLSKAFNDLSQTNIVSYFGSPTLPQKSLSEYIYLVLDSLVFAKDKINNAQRLLDEVDISILPPDKKELFLEFKNKIPQFQEFTDGAITYSEFLLYVVGDKSKREYLVLFQNNSELRPTGGFPGTYGVLRFNQGYLEEIFVDDIYNPDGQIKKNIIPPEELQHITPTWGMRDANWFADFPVSAKKTMEMYELDGGSSVDGVFTFTPTMMIKILKIIGPIEMPEYNVVLDSNNFLPLVQAEVEYGDNKEINQPKKIIVDFTPKFIEELARQDKEDWVKIFQILMEGMTQKHILAYLKEPSMQKVVLENDFAGEVKKTEEDFLLVTHSNVKGSKTDAVIRNSLDIETSIDGRFVEHTLKITRSHGGGNTPYGFYNRQNPDYVRVLVPEGSELISIKGNSLISINPIIDYSSLENRQIFVSDPDLKRYEFEAINRKGIKVFKESGKKGFGFWMLTDPQETKTVTLKYKSPITTEDGEYSMIIQKQSGTVADKLRFSFVPPNDKQIIFRYPQEIQYVNDSFILDSNLSVDREIEIHWR